MKLKILILFLLFLSQECSFLYSQEEISPYISYPDSPRKVEVIMIYSPVYLESFYYKSKDDIFYFGIDSILDSEYKIVWEKKFNVNNDSIKVYDFFDNLKIDNIENFPNQNMHCSDCLRAVYFKQKKVIFTKRYKIIKKMVVVDYW